MKLDVKELESIRTYLLGRSPQEERTQIEERLLTDSEYFQEILIGEEELTDEYIANQLSASDRDAFETNFLVTPERQRRVSFARRLKTYIGKATKTTVDEEIAAQPSEQSTDADDPPVFRQPKRPFFSFFPARNPILPYSLAAALLLVAVGVSWVAVRNWRTPPSGGSVLGVTLTPGLSRGDGEVPRIKLWPGLGSVELRLILPKTDYPVYRSVLLADDRSQVWASDDLRSDNDAGTRVNDAGTSFVVSSVPARLLAPGDYRITVSGRSSAGNFENIATYSFRVTR